MKKILAKNIILFAIIPFAVMSQDNGIVIAKEADKRDNGWNSVAMSFTMTLKNKSGQETVRKIHSYMMETANDGDKSLVVFDNPSDVKGTASLVYSHKTGDDDQWLYLPALKQVKRISSSNKSGPFMGSEFAYEDVSSQEVEKFSYKYVGISKVGEQDCYLVERYPLEKNSGYKRQQVWFNKTNYRIEKIDYYDRKDMLIKTLSYTGYKLYNEKFWRPDEMTMYNHQTGKQTITRFLSYQFNVRLSVNDFSQNNLQHAK